jgi:hypothetical protein
MMVFFIANGCFWMNSLVSLYALLVAATGKILAIISSVVQFHHKLRSDNNKIKAERKQSKYMHN